MSWLAIFLSIDKAAILLQMIKIGKKLRYVCTIYDHWQIGHQMIRDIAADHPEFRRS